MPGLPRKEKSSGWLTGSKQGQELAIHGGKDEVDDANCMGSYTPQESSGLRSPPEFPAAWKQGQGRDAKGG